jgi:plastocyanin
VSPGVFAFNGEVWVEGGYDNVTRRPYPPDQQVQIYSPATNSWRFGPRFATPRYYSSSAGAIGNRAYVVGGIDFISVNYPYDYLNDMESLSYVPCGSVTPTATPSCPHVVQDVVIQTFAFEPRTVTIQVGSTIRWTNYDTASHTATGTNGEWDSGNLAPYQVYVHRFDTPGTYPYHCERHPGMTGTIIVAACPSTVTPQPTQAITTTNTPTVIQTTHTPTAIQTTRTPTAVQTAGSTFTPVRSPTSEGSVTPVPTTCSLGFLDVSPSDYFYAAVRYLYCAGIISGYADGTFRPYSTTTRGQLSKIVTLAEGWRIECSQPPHFSDVPPGNPFFCYIETAYGHGIISGYADGTFRPGNNVTRAQLSKIVVQAEGWHTQCSGPGHFSDVPPSDPFYCYIETAYGHGIISGYADGTFRPGASATRGQISKIIYQAITAP